MRPLAGPAMLLVMVGGFAIYKFMGKDPTPPRAFTELELASADTEHTGTCYALSTVLVANGVFGNAVRTWSAPDEKNDDKWTLTVESVQQAQLGTQLPVLAASPEYLHSVRALGIWSLPDKSTPFKQAIEDQLEATLAYYEKQVDEQHWYGFWDFGDFMHSYDAERHVWRYDLGGMAWDNTELGTDMWLWMSFLRTGRADLFRLAEAMTRHTSEVDCYHLGKLAGLGSRHNVRHWGDGAKEAHRHDECDHRYDRHQQAPGEGQPDVFQDHRAGKAREYCRRYRVKSQSRIKRRVATAAPPRRKNGT